MNQTKGDHQTEAKIKDSTKAEHPEEITAEAAKKMMEENQEIELGEDSDTSFTPSDLEDECLDNESDSDDGESLSGEDEGEFKPKEMRIGDTVHYKLIYKDVEEDKMKKKMEMEAEDGESGEEEDEKNTEQTSFMEYREALTDEEMEKYDSDKDNDFNPCGENLSDEEYCLDYSQEDQDTESEPETEMCEDVHRKTGEKLMMLKIQDLKIPPPSGCGSQTDSPNSAVDPAMEVA